ncbi:MAG: hypothetical protein AAGA63_08375 [Pseudomonadota bacterium]
MTRKQLFLSLIALGLLGTAPLQALPQPDLNNGTTHVRIEVPKPKQANLLQLRGILGAGWAYIREDDDCYKMRLRLVAGDFGGKWVGIAGRKPIIMEFSDPLLVRALLSGDDIVSDVTGVSTRSGYSQNPIRVLSGISPETGFIINPGRHLGADMFGPKLRETRCENL